MPDKKDNDIYILRYRTINDLSDSEYDQYYYRFYKRNYKKLKKYLTIFEIIKLKKNGIFRSFFDLKTVYNKNINYFPTRFHYSISALSISVDFLVVMEALIRKNLEETKGLFRSSVNFDELNLAYKKLMKEIENKENIPQIINEMSEYNSNILSSLLKKLFENYNKLFPSFTIKIYVRIADIEDLNDKIICLKFLYLSLPKINRIYLEVIYNYCSLIYKKSTKNGKDKISKLDMYGYSVVIAPKIFNLNDKNINLDELKKLVDVVHFCFLKTKEILEIS